MTHPQYPIPQDEEGRKRYESAKRHAALAKEQGKSLDEIHEIFKKAGDLGLLGISNTTVDASITIKKNGVTLANLIESVAVTTAMPLSPQLTNLALTPPGTEFDEVVVQPVGTSRFFVANVFFCQLAICPSAVSITHSPISTASG